MKILGTGSVVGETKVANFEMFKLDKGFNLERVRQSFEGRGIDTSSMSDIQIYDAHVQQMSGIKTRYFAGRTAEELGAEASMLALEAAGLSAKDLDFIVACTFTEDKKIPNPALSIAHMIGNDYLPGMTPNAACAGFIHGLRVAYREISSGDVSRILVVSAEKLSAYTDYSDYKTAFLFGDGAGAAILGPVDKGGFALPFIGSEYSEEHIGLRSFNGAEFSKKLEQLQTFSGDELVEQLEISKIEWLIQMHGGANVLAKAIRAMEKSLAMALLYERHPQRVVDNDPAMCDKLLENEGLLGNYCKGIDWVIPHPANLRIFQNLRDRFSGIIDPQKFLENIVDEGNISGSSIPRILDINVRNRKIRRGDKVVLTAVGGGYTLGGAVFQY